MTLALAIATVIYVAIALGVFGTLPVQEVIASGGTALAVAAQPTLGDAGYLLMSITALFATAGATNAGLYPAIGLCDQLAADGTFPPALGARIGQRVSVGLLVAAALSLVLAIGFDLNAIASIGSAVALLVFGMCTVAHFRVRSETGARLSLLILAVTTAGIALVAFLLDLIINDPVSVAAMLVIVILAVILDFSWKRLRTRRAQVISDPTPGVAPAAGEQGEGVLLRLSTRSGSVADRRLPFFAGECTTVRGRSGSCSRTYERHGHPLDPAAQQTRDGTVLVQVVVQPDSGR